MAAPRLVQVLAERDALQAEVERLRAEARTWAADHAQPLADAVERLQDSLDSEVQDHAVAVRQRDALADALLVEVEARRWRSMAEWDQAIPGRLMEIGEQQDGAIWSREIQARGPNFTPTYRHTHFRECLHGEPEQALAALRLAGRHPGTGG